MATKYKFAGRTVKLPGAYSRIVSGRNNPPLDLDFGRVLIIASEDHDIMGGAGVNGENSERKDSIYSFRSLKDFQDFVGQGLWWKAGESLFQPNRFDPGASEIIVVKPCETTSASLTLDTTTSDNGVKLVLKTLDEGLLANGVIETIDGEDYLRQGYAFTVEPGERDPSKFIMKLWVSSYRGESSDTYSYDEITVQKARPILLTQSIEFENAQELIDWANNDKALLSRFIVSDTESKGTGVITPADLVTYADITVATGGNSIYGAIDFDDMLEDISDLNFNFVMYLSGENVHTDTETLKLVNFLGQQLNYQKFLFVGGSDDDLSESIVSSQVFNTDLVGLVHGGIKLRSRVSPTGFRSWNSHIHASYIVGRLAGLPPQVPITFKAINIDGLVDNLNVTKREDALDSGVIVTNFDDDRGLFIIEQGVNTLQDNDFTLNPDATSHVIQIKRIASQLNRELIFNAKSDLLSNPAGVNRNTLSEKDVLEWTKGYLQRKVATTDIDNLLISFQNITVTRIEDSYNVTYEFEPNSEIRIIFFTGFML